MAVSLVAVVRIVEVSDGPLTDDINDFPDTIFNGARDAKTQLSTYPLKGNPVISRVFLCLYVLNFDWVINLGTDQINDCALPVILFRVADIEYPPTNFLLWRA
jgi:hypothetical protein